MSDVYDLKPSEAELDDESLFDEVDKHRYCYCPPRCVAGTHDWITICGRCGEQQSRFEAAGFLND